jgi:hypothetical protein
MSRAPAAQTVSLVRSRHSTPLDWPLPVDTAGRPSWASDRLPVYNQDLELQMKNGKVILPPDFDFCSLCRNLQGGSSV